MIIFTFLLGVVFVTGSEKIANILFTGTPTMSMGDIVQGVRDVSMAGNALKNVAKGGLGLAKGIGGAGQAGVRGVQSAAAFGSGLIQAGKEASDAVTGSAGFKNDAQHFNDNGRDNSTSFHGVGGKNYLNGSEQGTTTYKRAKESAGSVASDVAQKAAAKILNKSRTGDTSMQRDLEKPSSADHPSKA